MSEDAATSVDEEAFLALLGAIRPELHRYCARLTGSVIDGEDVVQDAIARAFQSYRELRDEAALRAWLFRIAHNRALDLLRARASRAAEPLEAASDMADEDAPDPLDQLLRREALATAISRFIELPTVQCSAVILKDVLGHRLDDIAGLLDLSIDAVKAHLARGRARLRQINARAPAERAKRTYSVANQLYVDLFNRRDWDALRALLAEDVRLNQATHPVRTGASAGMFFTIYAGYPGVRLVPAWLEGEEVIAVFEQATDPAPHHFMRIDWRDGRIAMMRDFRYVPYVMEGAELVLDEGA